MEKLKILQIGEEPWDADLITPDNIEWLYCNGNAIQIFLEKLKSKELEKNNVEYIGKTSTNEVKLWFNAVILTSEVSELQLNLLSDCLEAHTLFYDEDFQLDFCSENGIFKRKVLRPLPFNGSRKEKIIFLSRTLFSEQYGAKLKVSDIDLNPDFKGEIIYEGNSSICFSGDFGEDFQPLFSFRYNLSSTDKAIEIWQEYQKLQGDNSIMIEVIQYQKGSLDLILNTKYLSENDLADPYILEYDESVGFSSISIFARGDGVVRFGALHWRYSRKGLGQFLIGGERYSDSKRQEFIYYFNPGDMKPPLNVYFSGFRGAEGFEVFYMMKRLGAPFLLIGDPRIEGGSFYLGTSEYESELENVLQKYLDYLQFDHCQLILSGLSMGSFGALYYGSTFSPHAIVVGKPFTNLGDMVVNLKLRRPDDFETSMDILQNIIGSQNDEAINQFNQKFWNKFKRSNFEKTQFAISYMKHDDYDRDATPRLIDYFSKTNTLLYASGYAGRHNDNSQSINNWFTSQYKTILSDDFGRVFSD